jgi:DNA-binding transcriptional LysR family regulator
MAFRPATGHQSPARCSDAAIAGAGVTRVLFYQATNAIRRREFAVTLEDLEPIPSPLSLVHAGGRLLPLKLRAFLDFALPRLKARLPEAAA